jgi:hypothetical protein
MPRLCLFDFANHIITELVKLAFHRRRLAEDDFNIGGDRAFRRSISGK